MDEGEFEKLTDQFKGDYERLLHAYNELGDRYDRLRTNVVVGILFIVICGGIILYKYSIWFAGIISAIWVLGIIGILFVAIVATVMRMFKRRR